MEQKHSTNHSTETSREVKCCSICNKKFANCILRNRHLKRVHKLTVSSSRKKNILCPLCKKQTDEMNTYESLRKHLKANHEITIENDNFEFSSTQEYEMWKKTENIRTMYACERKNQYEDYKEVHFVCNRSNTRRYQAKPCKRAEKMGGTIKIQGICPSKLIVKIYKTGKTIVAFWKTHVGHEMKELRSKHLLTTKKNLEKVVEVTEFVKEKTTNHESDQAGDDPIQKINTQREEFHKWLDNLSNEAFERFMENIQGARKDEDEIKNKVMNVTKRKMEKQEYVPINKRRKE